MVYTSGIWDVIRMGSWVKLARGRVEGILAWRRGRWQEWPKTKTLEAL